LVKLLRIGKWLLVVKKSGCHWKTVTKNKAMADQLSEAQISALREVFTFYVEEFVGIDQLGTVVRVLGYDLTDDELQQGMRANQPGSGVVFGQLLSLLAMARFGLLRGTAVAPCVQSKLMVAGSLPPTALESIAVYLPYASVLLAASTCRRWASGLREDAVWRLLALRDWPHTPMATVVAASARGLLPRPFREYYRRKLLLDRAYPHGWVPPCDVTDPRAPSASSGPRKSSSRSCARSGGRTCRNPRHGQAESASATLAARA
jgi:hypothetical protein